MVVTLFSASDGTNVLSVILFFSISNISVDAVVDRHVSSGISGAQRRESEFLRELISIRDRVLCLPSVFCQSDTVALIEHVCVS